MRINLVSRLWERFKLAYEFDLRSLALYRVLISLIVIIDLLLRLCDLEAFYTDFGVLPRDTFISLIAHPWTFSFHLATGSYNGELVLFIIHIIFAMMLLFGYRTKLATVLCFIMTVSLHNRNWIINNGGDDILRSLLFISIFLPLGKKFSMDQALQKNDEDHGNRFFSFWNIVVIFQIFAIYFMSYILKDHPSWRVDFNAVLYALRLDIFATKFAIYLRDFPIIAKAITVYTICLEWGGPLLLLLLPLFGKKSSFIRYLVISLFIALHIGIILCMKIGIFPYVCISMWLILIPTNFWNYLGNRKKCDKTIIHYDEECNFCIKGVRVFKSFLLLKNIEIKTAQSDPVVNKHMLEMNSWVVKNSQGELFYRFDAFIELLKNSQLISWMRPVFSLRPIWFIGNEVYLWVSSHRKIMGKGSQFFKFYSPYKIPQTFFYFKEVMSIVILISLFVWNISTLKKITIKSPLIFSIVRNLHLYQEWNMFAPFPKVDNIWIEVPALMSDGRVIEVLTKNSDIYSVKSRDFNEGLPNERWRKYFLNLSERNDYLEHFSKYLCRLWNTTENGRRPDPYLKSFDINVYSELNYLNGQKGAPVKKMSWNHYCYKE